MAQRQMRTGWGVLLLLLLAAAFYGTGCSASFMKGTPLYTGEYSKPQGPPEDRVNLWPLAYYHEPALSVLWPLCEFTDDHYAVRPFYSVYKLDRPKQQVNILWPLAQFDRDTGTNRIFPVFWGATPEKYLAVLPLLFCHGDAATAFNSITLLPFLFYERGRHLRVFPFYGRDNEGTTVLWPLGRFRGPGQDNRFFPVFWRTGESARFTLWPVVWHEKNRHTYVHPFFYRETDKLLHVVPFYRRTPTSKSVLWPLSNFTENEGSHVFPVYWKAAPNGHVIVFPFYWALGKGADLFHRLVVFPFYWRERGRYARVPWFYHRTGDNLNVLWPVYHRGPTGSRIWPLWGKYDDGETQTRFAAFHLFYERVTRSTDELLRVIAPFYMKKRKAGGDQTEWLFPAYVRIKEGAKSLFLSLAHQAGSDREKSWRASFPFFFERTFGDQELMLTPVYGTFNAPDRQTRMIPPLLTWYGFEGARKALWLLAPLARFVWSEASAESHIIPLYYYRREGDRKKLVSPLLASWHNGDRKTTLIPLALSWLTREGDARRLWGLLGLFGAKWGIEHPWHYFFPLYARHSKGKFYTPLFGWDRSGSDRFWYAGGPLVAHGYGSNTFWAFLLGLGGYEYDENASTAWLWPLFSRTRVKDTERRHGYAIWPLGRYDFAKGRVTLRGWPLFNYRRFGEGETRRRTLNILGPLGKFVKNPEETGFRIFPFFSRTHTRATETTKGYAPWPLVQFTLSPNLTKWLAVPFLYYKREGTGDQESRFVSAPWPLAAWYDNPTEKGWYVFPFYGHKRRKADGGVEGYAGLWPLCAFEFSDVLRKWRVAPFVWYSREGDPDAGEGKVSVQAFPTVWYERDVFDGRSPSGPVKRDEVSSGLWPLWGFERDRMTGAEAGLRRELSVLGRLYDSQYREGTVEGKPSTYLRRRVLWRAMHYEKSDGDSTLDVFPFITADTKADGFRKITFAWRAFRYERSAEGDVKLDVLFIPLRR